MEGLSFSFTHFTPIFLAKIELKAGQDQHLHSFSHELSQTSFHLGHVLSLPVLRDVDQLSGDRVEDTGDTLRALRTAFGVARSALCEHRVLGRVAVADLIVIHG